MCDKQTRLGGCVPGLFKYEPDFDPEKDINLKAHLKAHFENKTHVDNLEMMKKSEDKDRKFESRCHEVGLRIARLCYDGYKSGASKRAFENEVMKAVFNDTDLGNLNHSKLPHTGNLPLVCGQVGQFWLRG